MDSSMSSLVSSQGVASPPLSNGCGRELNGPSLYRDQGRMSDVPRETAGRAGEATAIAISPRPPEGPGALTNFRWSMAM